MKKLSIAGRLIQPLVIASLCTTAFSALFAAKFGITAPKNDDQNRKIAALLNSLPTR